MCEFNLTPHNLTLFNSTPKDATALIFMVLFLLIMLIEHIFLIYSRIFMYIFFSIMDGKLLHYNSFAFES